MVGGGLEDRGGALFLYRSADLRHWQYAGVFAAAADHGLDGVIWECPDVFVLRGTTVVVVSVWDGQPPYAMWMTGRVTGQRFVPEASGRCDVGHRYYAPQSLTLADGRRVAFGWLRECLGELAGPDKTRVGAMSLPRELFLDSSGALRSRQAGELDGARRETLLNRTVDGRVTAGVTLSARAAHATEISLTPVGRDVTSIGLRLTGPAHPDVQIEVTADGIEITEGGRRLTDRPPRAVPISRLTPRWARSAPGTTAGSSRYSARPPPRLRSSAAATAATTRWKPRLHAGRGTPRTGHPHGLVVRPFPRRLTREGPTTGKSNVT